MDTSLVVKVSGSLWDWIPDLVKILKQSTHPLLIVPGGGPFADLIRSLHLSEDSSHWMAIAAMDQYAWYISSFGIQPTDAMSVPTDLQVLLPYKPMREHDPLPHIWDITSDTISAWVASQLNLDLLLLKSVDGIFSHGKLIERLEYPIECKEVDPAFLPFVFSHRIHCTILNGRRVEQLALFLNENSIQGTVIDTRF